MPEEFDPKNVGEFWPIYDRCLIGPSVDPKYPGGFQSFTEMAQADEIPFLNIRNSSEAGKTNTNITSKDKIPWRFDLNSIGIRFVFPDPNAFAASEHNGLTTASKWFMQYLPEYAVFDFKIREDIRLTALASHLPAGHGPTGSFEVNTGGNRFFGSIINNGEAVMNNRWKFFDNIAIPRDTPISGTLRFDDYGKDLLRQIDEVPGIDFGGEQPFANRCFIELTLRGARWVQQRGEYHNL